MHYQRIKHRREMPPIDRAAHADARFAVKTRELENGCVEWIGGRSDKQYGVFRVGRSVHYAHRWKWQRDNGPLDPKLALDHYLYPEGGCIGPLCVLHVRPATWRENTLRGDTPAARNLAKTHCHRGHVLTGSNLRLHDDGRRECRTCHRESGRRHDGWKGQLPAEQRTHCPHGHPYDEANTLINNRHGHRACRECRRQQAARRRAARQKT